MGAYSTNLDLELLPDIDRNKYPDIFATLVRHVNAIRILQGALDLYTGSAPTVIDPFLPLSQSLLIQKLTPVFVISSETILSSQIVNFWNNSGILNARKAIGTTWEFAAHAFCSKDVSSGDIGQFSLLGNCSNLFSLTPAANYYLSSTIPGAVTIAAAGISQIIGFALTSNNLFFNPVRG